MSESIRVAEIHNKNLPLPRGNGVSMSLRETGEPVGETVLVSYNVVWVRDTFDANALQIPYMADSVMRDLSTTSGRLSFIRRVLADSPRANGLALHSRSPADKFRARVRNDLEDRIQDYHSHASNSVPALTALGTAMSFQLVLAEDVDALPVELEDDVWESVCDLLLELGLLSEKAPQKYFGPRE